MPDPLRYWDSDAFIGWLAGEPDKVHECRGVIRAAEKGELRIVTSSLTLTEVIKLKRKPALGREHEQTINEFFKHEWIVVRQLDRFTAEYARELVWEHNFDPKDSIHVATAVRAGIPHLDTFDAKLIKRSGKIGDPPIIIGRPDVPEQLSLDDVED